MSNQQRDYGKLSESTDKRIDGFAQQVMVVVHQSGVTYEEALAGLTRVTGYLSEELTATRETIQHLPKALVHADLDIVRQRTGETVAYVVDIDTVFYLENDEWHALKSWDDINRHTTTDKMTTTTDTEVVDG